MPRDGSGGYTPPAGNPVLPNTTIESNWANSTVNDLGAEIQDSLSRSGKGTMSVPFRAVDGSAAMPGYTFASELNSGIYRAGPGDIRSSVLGSDAVRVAGGLTTSFLDFALEDAGGTANQKISKFSVASDELTIQPINDSGTVNSAKGRLRMDLATGGVTVDTAASPGGFSGGGTIRGEQGVYDGSERVYSPNNPPESFAPGTTMVFYQNTAPTGWTRSNVTSGGRAIKLADSGDTGGTTAGSVTFDTVFGRTVTDGHQLTIAEMPAHDHTGALSATSSAEGGANLRAYNQTRVDTGSTGGDGSHSHNIDLRVNYAVCILASKD